MQTELNDHLIRRIQGEIEGVDSATVESGLLRIHYQRTDGRARRLETSIIEIDDSKLDELIEGIRGQISIDNRLSTRT